MFRPNKGRGWFGCAVAVLAALAVGQAAVAQNCDLYGTDASGNNLLRINPADGSSVVVGNTGLGATPSLAVDPSTNIMYAGHGQGTPLIYTINPADGSATLLGDSLLGFAAIGGLDFGPDGKLYAAVNVAGDGGTGSDHLATIDLTNGVATIIGPFGSCTGVTIPTGGGGSCTIEGIEAIAFDSAGNLWGAKSARGAAGSPGLYSINTGTGSATFHAAILDVAGAPPSGGVVSLKFCNCDGKLYGGTARAQGGADGGRLVVIDSASGAFSFTGGTAATGGSSLGGLAQLNAADCATPVPTVSEWGLIVMVLLLFVGGKVYFGRRRLALT